MLTHDEQEKLEAMLTHAIRDVMKYTSKNFQLVFLELTQRNARFAIDSLLFEYHTSTRDINMTVLGPVDYPIAINTLYKLKEVVQKNLLAFVLTNGGYRQQPSKESPQVAMYIGPSLDNILLTGDLVRVAPAENAINGMITVTIGNGMYTNRVPVEHLKYVSTVAKKGDNANE